MSSPNPFDNPVDDDGGREPLFDEATEPKHLKAPGGTIYCGVMPHAIISTMSADQADCKPCLEAYEAAQSTPA